MKRLVIVCILLFSIQLSAQRDEAFVNKLVDEFTEKLEARSITNWFTGKRYCTGSIEMFQMEDGSWCSSKGTYFEVYVLWEEDGTTMIKKIDNCGLFYTIPLKSNELIQFVDENYLDLQSTSVKTYYADNISGTPELRTTVSPCKRSFVFKKTGGMMKQNYNLYDLTTSEKHPNTHYEYNNSLKIVDLDKKLSVVIEALQTKFKRQKQ